MTSHYVRNTTAEKRIFVRRAWILLLFAGLGFLIIGLRFAYLQVYEHDTYATKSDHNRYKLRPVPPTRGLIYDRNGELLADNAPAYRLEVVPEQVQDLDSVLTELKSLVGLSDEDIVAFQQAVRSRRAFHSIPLKFRLTEAELAAFAVDQHRFPGVEAVAYLTRVYPYQDAFAHVVGYVGRINQADLNRLDRGEYAGTTHIGKTGIERQYESDLHGVVGHEKVEVNALGRGLRIHDKQPPELGSDLHLTIDANLQLSAIEALQDFAGAIVALDPATGEVLALVSRPAFDPNLFVNGISAADYRSLLHGPNKPLFHRAVQGGYEPGSTMKPFIALAGLHHSVINPEETVMSTGRFQLPDQEREYRDWRKGGHGRVNLTGAIGQSVNIYFYQLAVELGIDRIANFLQPFGFGQRTGIELGGELNGILPSPEWKQANRGQPWYLGETVITGIGQGFFVTTPVQLASATAVIASRGQRFRPHLVRSVFTAGQKRVSGDAFTVAMPEIESSHYDAVIDGMIEVVHGSRGTARGIAPQAYRMAGKTGTAQVVSRPDEDDEQEEVLLENIPVQLRNHALFSAFAPAEDPQIVVVVVVEHGGGGSSVAAPIARQVLDSWLLPRIQGVNNE